MKINLAKSAGFCFGVRRALQIAFQTAKSNKKVEMLGNIVHNEDVVKQIKKAGIKKIVRFTKGKNKTLLIRAHGACSNTINKAKKADYKIIDATCPMVKEIHTIVKNMEKKGYKIIIVGDKKHDEVRGIIGEIKTKPIVIDNPKAISPAKLKKIKKAAMVVQSTQNIENVSKILEILKKSIKELKFFNTICRPTTDKQQEIKKMPLKNDVMIIIGSKASANTKRLYEISKAINKASYWVQSRKDLKKEWFKNAKSVGITTGASTPQTTTKDIIKYIKQLTNVSIN
jgi:4-hydroxy-3-methylbut-2-enyl diphosphate reductase